MFECVTSEHCCEISNLIHEEVVVEWRSGDGLLQAALKKDKRLLKKLFAFHWERAHTHIKRLCDVSTLCVTHKNKQRQREATCHLGWKSEFICETCFTYIFCFETCIISQTNIQWEWSSNTMRSQREIFIQSFENSYKIQNLSDEVM